MGVAVRKLTNSGLYITVIDEAPEGLLGGYAFDFCTVKCNTTGWEHLFLGTEVSGSIAYLPPPKNVHPDDHGDYQLALTFMGDMAWAPDNKSVRGSWDIDFGGFNRNNATLQLLVMEARPVKTERLPNKHALGRVVSTTVTWRTHASHWPDRKKPKVKGPLWRTPPVDDTEGGEYRVTEIAPDKPMPPRRVVVNRRRVVDLQERRDQ